jgi:hypothetical protein
MFTREQIALVYVAPDAPRNRARSAGSKIVWEWECPGEHTFDRRTVSYADERAMERDILADPYCWKCRRDRTAQ